MSTTVTGKLNKPARVQQTDKSTMFFINIGVQVFDRSTGQKEWTNYDIALFANDKQVQFYESSLIAGAIVSVSAPNEIIRVDPTYGNKIELVNARLEYVHSGQQAPQQNFQQPQSQGFQQPQAPQGSFQAPQQGGFQQQQFGQQ